VGIASNLWFWKNTGYFDAAAESNPLLHIWSLSVEEQFYVLFPILLLVVLRYGKARTSWILFFLALLSLIASEGMLSLHSPLVFYVPVFRAWELLLGCLLAVTPLPIPRRWHSEILAILGLILIAAAVFGFSGRTRFPGIHALLPCTGAALLIYSGSGSWAARMLSLRPVVFVGLVSYSLYLWHWPVKVFIQYRLGRPFSPGESILLVLLSFGLAVLSWRYVERPFRKPAARISRAKLFAFTGLLLAVLFGWNAVVWAKRGLPSRFDPLTVALDREAHPEIPFENCAGAFVKGHPCRVGDRDQDTASLLIWGDSHSIALLPALDRILREEKLKGLIAAAPRCPPLLGVIEKNHPSGQACYDHNVAVRAFLESHPEVDRVVLAASWFRYSADFDSTESDNTVLTLQATGVRGNAKVFPEALRETLKFLLARKIGVIVLGPSPWVGWNVPEKMLRAHRFGEPLPPTWSLGEYRRHQDRMRQALADLGPREQLAFVDVGPMFYRGDSLIFSQDGLPLYRDEDHLGVRGNDFVLPALRAALDSSLEKARR